MGSQRQFACYKEEGKNCPLKRHIATCNNFKNPPKTAMEQAQIHVSKVWGTPHDITEDRVFVGVQNVAMNMLPVALQLNVLGFVDEDVLRTCQAVHVRCFDYRIGEFLLYSKPSENANGLPRIGQIVSIICPEGSDLTWFAMRPWETAGLVERFNAYVVRAFANAPVHLVDFADLPLHPPIRRWRDYSSRESYPLSSV